MKFNGATTKNFFFVQKCRWLFSSGRGDRGVELGTCFFPLRVEIISNSIQKYRIKNLNKFLLENILIRMDPGDFKWDGIALCNWSQTIQEETIVFFPGSNLLLWLLWIQSKPILLIWICFNHKIFFGLLIPIQLGLFFFLVFPTFNLSQSATERSLRSMI